MRATIVYRITEGIAPFIVSIDCEGTPVNVHWAIGTFQFENIPEGSYTITVTDASSCSTSFPVDVECCVLDGSIDCDVTTTIEPTTTLEPIATTAAPTTITEPTTTSEPTTTADCVLDGSIDCDVTTTIEPTTTLEPIATTAAPTTITEPTTTLAPVTTVEELTTTITEPTTTVTPTTTEPTTTLIPTTTVVAFCSGILYNWPAITHEDDIAPSDFHVATEEDWSNLLGYLGGEEIAGGKAKSTSSWNDPNTGATDEYEFAGLPSGRRYYMGAYFSKGDKVYYWIKNTNTPTLTTTIEITTTIIE